MKKLLLGLMVISLTASFSCNKVKKSLEEQWARNCDFLQSSEKLSEWEPNEWCYHFAVEHKLPEPYIRAGVVMLIFSTFKSSLFYSHGYDFSNVELFASQHQIEEYEQYFQRYFGLYYHKLAVYDKMKLAKMIDQPLWAEQAAVQAYAMNVGTEHWCVAADIVLPIVNDDPEKIVLFPDFNKVATLCLFSTIHPNAYPEIISRRAKELHLSEGVVTDFLRERIAKYPDSCNLYSLAVTFAVPHLGSMGHQCLVREMRGFLFAKDSSHCRETADKYQSLKTDPAYRYLGLIEFLFSYKNGSGERAAEVVRLYGLDLEYVRMLTEVADPWTRLQMDFTLEMGQKAEAEN